MRQIGTLPRSLDPKAFSDYLLAQGIKARVDDRPEGWQVWVYNEDHFARAKTELEGFVKRPDDPRFEQAGQAARKVRQEEAKRDREYQKNFREVTDLWSGLQIRRRPVTSLLVAISVGVYILQNWPSIGHRVEDWLGFFSWTAGPPELRPWRGLTDIYRGELWRLITPIFMHFGFIGAPILHLLFNMWWLSALGTLIELRRGSRVLGLLVLVTAVGSNVCEYYYMAHYLDKFYLFGGMSGVVYGLFGYVWMKTLYQPEQGMIVHPNQVSVMIFWLVLCMTGIVGPIANAAHVGGISIGVALGASRL